MLEEYFNLLQCSITFLRKKDIAFRPKVYKITFFFVTSHKKNIPFADTFYSSK